MPAAASAQAAALWWQQQQAQLWQHQAQHGMMAHPGVLMQQQGYGWCGVPCAHPYSAHAPYGGPGLPPAARGPVLPPAPPPGIPPPRPPPGPPPAAAGGARQPPPGPATAAGGAAAPTIPTPPAAAAGGGNGAPAAASAPSACASCCDGGGDDGVCWVLLDAGEGTLGAIQRLFGEEGAEHVLQHLACIWVSHKHADHMLGVPALLEARARALAKQLLRRQGQAAAGGAGVGGSLPPLPLLLVGPQELHDWLAALPGSSGWHYHAMAVEAFGGFAPPVREQQAAWLQQQQQQLMMMQRAWGAHLPQQPLLPQAMGMACGGASGGRFVPPPAWGMAGQGFGGPQGVPAPQPQLLQPQQLHAQPAGDDVQQPWCISMPCQQLAAWQQWQRQCFGGSPAAAVLSGVCGFTRWQSVAVQHCPGAQGLVLEHSQGWKLVYSGDTRPCAALVEAGRGATLLIHESTFEPDLQHHAAAKGHSTLTEALGVAQDMGAYRTALTHFSQRYPRLPGGFPAAATPWRRRPLLAVDGAMLRFDLLPDLPALMPAVAAALEEAEEEEEDGGGGGGQGAGALGAQAARTAAGAGGVPSGGDRAGAAAAAAGGGDEEGQLLAGLADGDDGGAAGAAHDGCCCC